MWLRYAFYFVYILVLLMVVYSTTMGIALSSLGGLPGLLIIGGGIFVTSLIFYIGSYKYVFNACNNCDE